MTRLGTPLLAALLATATAVGPALADPGAGVEGGLSCGLAMTGDGNRYSGVIAGGPYVVRPGTSAAIRCFVQVVRTPDHREIVYDTGTAAQPGVAMLGPSPVAFTAPPAVGMTFEVCTEVTIYDPSNPTRVVSDDADNDPTNGYQCPKATPTGGGTVNGGVYVKPAYLLGPPCIRVWADPNRPAGAFCT